METFVSYIVKNLVDNPDAVEATCTAQGREILVEVRVAPEDLGKVIGRKGKTIQAVRTIATTAAAREGVRARVELIDDERPERGAPRGEESSPKEEDASPKEGDCGTEECSSGDCQSDAPAEACDVAPEEAGEAAPEEATEE